MGKTDRYTRQLRSGQAVILHQRNKTNKLQTTMIKNQMNKTNQLQTFDVEFYVFESGQVQYTFMNFTN